MKKVFFTLFFVATGVVMFAQSANKERADETSFPEIDNLSALTPDEDQLNTGTGVTDLSQQGAGSAGTGFADESINGSGNIQAGEIKQTESKLQNAEVYPNPAQDFVYVSTDVTEGTIMILNLLGQQMRTETITTTVMSLDISGLKEGIYFISITSGDVNIVKKIKVL